VTKAALSVAVTVATAAVGQAADYTAASWSAYTAALAAARGVLADPAATQAAVDAAVASLGGAVAGLVRVPATAPGDGSGNNGGGTGEDPGGDPSGAPNTAISKVKAAQKAITLVRGKKANVPVRSYTAAGPGKDVVFKSSNPKIAKVNRKTGKITAVKKGQAKIKASATAPDATGLVRTASIKVKVVAKAKKAKRVKAAAPSRLAVGEAKGVYGRPVPASATGAVVAYSSSNSSVLAVDKAGTLTAKKAGKARLTVKAGGKSKTYTVTVTR
jgi:uncharacterized protein (UPF0333 family)